MKYALFDCDGTLLDSMAMWVNLATDVLKTYGVDLPCLLYTSPSPRDRTRSRMPSSA